MKSSKYTFLAFLISASASCFSQSSTTSTPAGFKAEDYSTEEGWGHLVIDRSGNKSNFSIRTSPTPTGSCELKGVLSGTSGIARNGNTTCSIQFNPTKKGLAIAMTTAESCKTFCGWNGSFEGEYLRIPHSCTEAEIKKTRQAFRRLYDAKRYNSSLSILEPVLNNCSPVLDVFDLGWIRNDVALAQYKNGSSKACLATLKPYAEDAKRKDDEIVADWGGSRELSDKYLAIISAARTNLRLCQK